MAEAGTYVERWLNKIDHGRKLEGKFHLREAWYKYAGYMQERQRASKSGKETEF